MAKTKKKRLMTSILDDSANYYLGGGDTNSYYTQQMVTDNDGMRRMQFMPSESTMTNPFDEPVGGYTSRQQRLVNKQARIDEDAADAAAGKSASNVNVGGAIGAAATNISTALSNPNLKTSEKVATALGAPALAKIWSPNTEAADNALREAQNRINDATNRYITDANDIQGAFSGIKENNRLNLINLDGIKQPTLKDFIGKRFINGANATLQGAASGSIGGPWGALGGAIVGTFGSLFGGIGQKRRAKNALSKFQDDFNYYRRFASNYNSFQKLNQQQSNENLLNNGLRQQRIQDLANVRAYGGNLFALGDEMSNPYSLKSFKSFIEDPTSNVPSSSEIPDVGTSPLGLNRVPYADAKFIPQDIQSRKIDPNNPMWATNTPFMEAVQAAADYNADYYNKRRDKAHENVLDLIKAGYGPGLLAGQRTPFIEKELTNTNIKYKENKDKSKLNLNNAGNDLASIWINNFYTPRVFTNEQIPLRGATSGGEYKPYTLTEDDGSQSPYANSMILNPKMLEEYDKTHGTDLSETSDEHENHHSGNLEKFMGPLFNIYGLTKFTPQQQAILKSYPKASYPTYWLNPDEVVSRRQEFRKSMGLDPRDEVTKEFLNRPEVRQQLKTNHLDFYTDDQLLKLFNKVVDNNNTRQYDNVAAYGGNLFDGGGNVGFKSELDWSPESWFSKRVAKPDGTYYNEEEAKRLASHVPEYNQIEQDAKANGTWLKMPDGTTWQGDPRSWVMMQSEAYKKNYSDKPWYTGQGPFKTQFDYGNGLVDTDMVTALPYSNDQMWFSDNKGYGDYFADYATETGIGFRDPFDENYAGKGHNFLAAIPKEGNYRTLESPSTNIPDDWRYLPYNLVDNNIERLPADQQYTKDYSGIPTNRRIDNQKVKTDDVVNWSKDLGDEGIFMQNINDGPSIIRTEDGDYLQTVPINEFISHPDFTKKVKFIEGNTGDFDINNPYKYSMINDNNYNNIAAMGGQFDFNLSPNMIDLQNQSLANQRYKYMNQMQPVGFAGGPGDKEPNPGFPRLACGGKLHLNKFDFGGSMSMEDLPDNMQVYGNGGTHEENPNGGIQVGVDQQGTPNLVEQGEFRYGDYVFSDRINVDPELLTEFNLAPVSKGKKKKNESYADAAKKMVKKAGDLNDPITKDTIDANMDRLKNAQEAQKFKEQQDQQLADYKSALKTPTQGNPMYGSMKYNGMGDVNQGLNEGVDSGMGAMDNSSLSNVNRSGNEMMAAYGGNLFAGGTPNLNIRRINEPALNWNDLAIQRSLPTPQYMTDSNVGNDMLVEPVDYSQMARNYDDNWLNDKWNAYGELNNYYTPEQIANLRGSFGMSISGGVDKPFVQALQQDLKNKGYYKGKIDGDFGPNTRMALDKMNGTYAWTGENGKYVAPQTTTTAAKGASDPFYTSTGKSFSYSKSSGETVNKDVNYKDDPLTVSKDAAASGTTQNPQQSVNSLGDLQRLNAQYATGNPFDAPSYNTSGKLATNAKFLPAVFADSTGFTNFDYDPNLAPNYDLVAAGKTGYIPRTAGHSGMYRSAELFDINAANNAAQAQAQATARAMRNVNDRNQGAANQLAADYNAMLGIGNNYQTMFDTNMKSRLATDDYNKQTEQTNVQANNDMYKDNQNAGIQAKQMELNTLAQSMADQTQKELYADKTNRDAHDNIAGNQNAMWNNTMQFFMDEAQRNDLYNKFNSDASQMWYYDKKLGKYVFKGDPAQAYLGTAMRTAENPVTSLDADLLKQYNDYVAKVGSQNVSREFIDNLVYQQGQRNQEKEAKSIADRNAQMQSDIDFMNTQFSDLDNLTITDKDKSYKFFDYINSPKQVEAVRNFLANADVSQMNPNDYKNYKALLDNWMRMRDRQLMYRNQISPYNVADATNTTWVGQDNQAYGGYINSNKKKKKQYYTDI